MTDANILVAATMAYPQISRCRTPKLLAIYHDGSVAVGDTQQLFRGTPFIITIRPQQFNSTRDLYDWLRSYSDLQE